jgi:GNAT superfamily N-acetyltransferase
MIYRFFRRLLGRLVLHEAQHVIVGAIDEGPATPQAAEDWTECEVLETRQELEAIAAGLPSGLLPERLCRWFEPGRILILVRRRCGPNGEPQVVGYRLCERGVLQSTLGLRARIPDTFLFIHHAMVLPEHRGQRIAQALREASYRFAARHNIAWTCGVVSLSNAASLAAHQRPGTGTRVVATIHKLSFFGGRLFWRTRWRTIARALEALATGQKTFAGEDLSFDKPRQ